MSRFVDSRHCSTRPNATSKEADFNNRVQEFRCIAAVKHSSTCLPPPIPSLIPISLAPALSHSLLPQGSGGVLSPPATWPPICYGAFGVSLSLSRSLSLSLSLSLRWTQSPVSRDENRACAYRGMRELNYRNYKDFTCSAHQSEYLL